MVNKTQQENGSSFSVMIQTHSSYMFQFSIHVHKYRKFHKTDCMLHWNWTYQKLQISSNYLHQYCLMETKVTLFTWEYSGIESGKVVLNLWNISFDLTLEPYCCPNPSSKTSHAWIWVHLGTFNYKNELAAPASKENVHNMRLCPTFCKDVLSFL